MECDQQLSLTRRPTLGISNQRLSVSCSVADANSVTRLREWRTLRLKRNSFLEDRNERDQYYRNADK
jgi:hypothetical protein